METPHRQIDGDGVEQGPHDQDKPWGTCKQGEQCRGKKKALGGLNTNYSLTEEVFKSSRVTVVFRNNF